MYQWSEGSKESITVNTEFRKTKVTGRTCDNDSIKSNMEVKPQEGKDEEAQVNVFGKVKINMGLACCK